ncbi:MAG: sulfur reduction protein DsrJ [Pseudomonadota bacterium]|nr:sulfur reduction protein DsrJ [Pseudomonadota bacterium]
MKTMRAATLLAAVLLLPPVLSASEPEGEAHGAISQTRSKAAAAESCVRPVEEMRRNHMELLKHKRDETMHRGIRTTDASLAGCIECHSDRNESGEFVPVDAEGQFCQSCHADVATKLDCFGCHRTTPETADQ